MGVLKSCLTRPGFCGLYEVNKVNTNQKRHLSFSHCTSFLPGMSEGQGEDTGTSWDRGRRSGRVGRVGLRFHPRLAPVPSTLHSVTSCPLCQGCSCCSLFLRNDELKQQLRKPSLRQQQQPKVLSFASPWKSGSALRSSYKYRPPSLGVRAAM